MPLIMKNGIPYSGNDSRTVTMEEYNALPESLKNCGITYYIPNATSDGLPIPTTADNGKLVGVVSGNYALTTGSNSHQYSTTEQIVGKWIDGTTDVYEITIYDSTINITAQTSQVIANIPNIDIVVSADGCILESGGTTPIGNAVGLWVNNSDVYILTEGNRAYAGSAYITLRYTKSTTS